MTGFITGFADYLGNHGFSISQNKIDSFLILCQHADITDISSLMPLMSVFFCTCREECMALEELFWNYFKNRDIYKNGVKNGKKELYNDYEKKKQELLDKYASTGMKREFPSLKKTEQKLLAGSRDIFEKISKEHADSLVSGDIRNLSVQDIERIMEDIAKESRDRLYMGKEISQYTKLFQLMKSLKKSLSGFLMPEEERQMKMKKKLNKKMQELEEEHRKKQEELDQIMDRMSGKNAFHRPEFKGGHHAVIYGNFPEFKKDFEDLSDREYDKIIWYIRDNVMHFKTRMLRKLYGNHGISVNMERTIKEACRTGGLPMQVVKNEPVPNKTKLVLMLDISGSCSAASSMMLSFMKILKDVFPEGCRVFVFVNSLYDVSPIMEKENNGKSSIKQVFKAVPVRGVYSDYGIPFKTMWEEYRMEITHDTVFIVMGDARNNKRENGEEYVKNISHTVKKALWLNTEPYSEWGYGDSEALLYARYFRMYEAVNAAGLFNFIWNI